MTEETKKTNGGGAEQPKKQEPADLIVAAPQNADLAPIGEKGIVLRTFEELRRFAELAVRSGAAPKGMTSGGAAMAIQAGLERGLGPLGGLQFCTVINGNLAWNAQGASALIRNSPVCKRGSFKAWVEGEGDERKGIAVAHRVGYKEATRVEFSWADAKKAKLTNKDNWQKYPDRQLRARAIGYLARDDYSDVLGGFALAEEAMDFEDWTEGKTAPPSSPPSSIGPPPTGPDRILEALEKAPAVIDIEPAEQAAEKAEDVLEGEVSRVTNFVRAEASDEEEKPEGASSLRSKLGIESPRSPGEAEPAEVLSAARSNPSSTYQGMHPEAAQEGDVEASEGETEPETQGAEFEAQDGAQDEDEQPTPPRGVPAITDEDLEAEESDRTSHLEADRELAKQEGLFNEGSEES